LDSTNSGEKLALSVCVKAENWQITDGKSGYIDISADIGGKIMINAADTAWLLTASVLVLFMTLPGLALFYAGLVRSKNILSVLMHCFALACLMSVLWVAVGFSLAFGTGSPYVGGFGNAFLAGIGVDTVQDGTAIPASVFVMFQMTFAIITPALIVGAYVERIKFGAVLLFSSLWLLVVYAPVTHWVWGGGWLAEMGVMDFAGGIVVHTTAGVSALVLAIMLGKRDGFPGQVNPPHAPWMVMVGASMLWVGWFGFNAGSALASDGSAGMAMLVTHISAAVASLVWMTIEWIRFGKPSMVGIVTGTIAGLATITPASGFVGPMGAIIIGIVSGGLCYAAVDLIKRSFVIDDSLDVFAVHGVGGMTGSLLVAFLALETFGGAGLAEGVTAIDQLMVQIIGVGATLIWSAIATVILVKITQALVGLRTDPDIETQGLDLTVHGENGYNIGFGGSSQ
jgi:Amt family ammonium transporter